MRSEVLVIGPSNVAAARAGELRAAGLVAWTAVDLDESRRLLDRSWIHPTLMLVHVMPGDPRRAGLLDGLASLARRFTLPVIVLGAEPGELHAFPDVRGDLPGDASARDVIDAIGRALATKP